MCANGSNGKYLNGCKIAIVAASCRFPGGSNSPEGFWEFLEHGFTGVGDIRSDRWDSSQFFHPSPSAIGRYHTKRAGMLEDVAGFDAAFFGISPREAQQMDPQQRLLLELAWETFERAGMPMERIAGTNCSVYVGISATDYGSRRSGDPAGANNYFMLGSTLSLAANRLSHYFDLRGASSAIDTACSSALVALDEAVHSLLDGRSEMALVGGMHLLLSPYPFIGFSRATMLSDYGECRAFAKGAKGYVRAEGGGTVLLKPLSRAESDGDPILAVIRGSGTNNDGRTPGVAYPSVRQQEALLRNVYDQFGLDPEDLVYLEAHGTGTPVGDPIEAQAIGRALGRRRQTSGALPIGSVKTNIGHLEPASGMAGLIKAIGVLVKGVIPPSLHAAKLNPDIPFEDLNIRVVQTCEKISLNEGTALVGVNSFGFGGANAHVVLAGYQPPAMAPQDSNDLSPRPVVLALSGRTETSLQQVAGQVAALIESGSYPLRDIAYTAAVRRTHHDNRLLVRADNSHGAAFALRRFATGQADETVVKGTAISSPAKLAFVFAGNGGQGTEEGLRLMIRDPVFQEEVGRADALVRAVRGWSIIAELALPEEKRQASSLEIVQPLSFAIQAGLVKALIAEGLRPDAVTGHSFGETSAAWAAGFLTFEQAILLMLKRTTIQESLRGKGGMAAVSIDERRAADEIAIYQGRLEIAAVNSPNAVTLTGDLDCLRDLKRRISKKDVSFRILDHSYAFHSRYLEQGRDRLLRDLDDLKFSQGTVPFYSTVTGLRQEAGALTPGYWWKNLRQCVRFDLAMSALIGDGHTLFMEIGAYPVLQAYIRHSLRASKVSGQPLCVISKQTVNGAAQRVSETVARAYTLGARLNWQKIFPTGGRFVQLPTYPFEREKYWFPVTDEAKGPLYQRAEGALIGARCDPNITAWENIIDTDLYPFLADHVIGGSVVFPASGFLEIALEVASAVGGAQPVEIELLQIHRPLLLEAGKSRRLLVRLSDDGDALKISSKSRMSEEAWSLQASARVLTGRDSHIHPLPSLANLPGEKVTIDAQTHYEAGKAVGLQYRSAFRVIKSAVVKGHHAEAELSSGEDATGFEIHPALLDGAFQTVLDLMLCEAFPGERVAFLPCQVERTIVFKPREVPHKCRAFLAGRSPRSLLAHFDLLDQKGEVLASLRGVRFQRTDLHRPKVAPPLHHVVEFVPLEIEGPSPLLPTVSSLVEVISRHRKPRINLDKLVTEENLKFGSCNGSSPFGQHPGLLPELLLAGGRGLASDGLESIDESGRGLELLLDASATSREFNRILTQVLDSMGAEVAAARKLRLLEVVAVESTPSFELNPERFAHDRLVLSRSFSESLPKKDFPSALERQGIRSRQFDLIFLCHPFWFGWDLPHLLSRTSELLAPGGRLVLASYTSPVLSGNGLLPRDSEWQVSLEKAGFINVAVTPASAGVIAIAEGSPANAKCGRSVPVGSTVCQKWLIAIGDSAVEDHLAHDLAFHLAAMGHGVQFLRDEASFRADILEIGFPFREPAAWRKALEIVAAGGESLGIIYLKGLSQLRSDNQAIEQQAWPIACLAQSVARDGPAIPLPTLVLVTAGAQSLPEHLSLEGPQEAPHQAALWGFARVLRNEFPDWKCRTIDLHALVDEVQMLGAILAAEILSDHPEDEVIRGAERRVGLRIRTAEPPSEDITPTENSCLELGGNCPGLTELHWRPKARRAPEKGNVEIEVKAVGLNFRDVMYGLGALPDEALENGFAGATLGMEGAGVIRTVGPGVKKFSPGDKVFFFGPASFATHVVTMANAAALMPADLDFSAAATIPTAFFTVTYALENLARLRAGERILIHGAAGAVGLATIQFAHYKRAEIFATVGSPEKRQLLRLLGVPENRIFDSRALSFGDDILAATGGEGVDVVLNSLAGEAVEKGLSILRPFGRFIELGKRDFYANSRIGLRPFRNNVSYFGVDADQLFKLEPGMAAGVFRKIATLLSKRIFRPLPYQIFEGRDVVGAFRRMQKGHHMGKIVVTPPPLPVEKQVPKPAFCRIDPEAVYLIIGGTSGLGLASASRLVSLGARRLVLVGKRYPFDEETQKAVGRLAGEGAKVELKACDISKPGQLQVLIEEITARGPPIRGIIHAATVYEDFPIASMTPEQFRHVVAVKAEAALQLREILTDKPVDFLLFYSSIAAVLGNPGQASYAAANAVLDALAAVDSRKGGPSVSIGWGAISDVGHLTRRQELKAVFEEGFGVRPMASEEALRDFPRLLSPGSLLLRSGHVIVASVDWSALALRIGCGLDRQARFQDVAPAAIQGALEAGNIQLLVRNLSPEEVLELTLELLTEQVGEVLGIAPQKIDRNKPFRDFGMDSLTATELWVLVEKKFGFEFPLMMIGEGATVTRLASRIRDFLLSSSSTEPSGNPLDELYARHGESEEVMEREIRRSQEASLRESSLSEAIP